MVAKPQCTSRTTEYRSWDCMKQRCLNPNSTKYKNYGGRGITICQVWIDSFEQFFADMGKKPQKDMSLDRIDVDKGYSPDNCRWATAHIQSRNTTRTNNITINGVTKCLTDWAHTSGRDCKTIRRRMKQGVKGEKLLEA